MSNSNKIMEQLIEAQSNLAQGKEIDPKTKYVKKSDVLAIVDKIIAQSNNFLSAYQVRSVEARAMINGVRNEIEKL